MSGYREILRLNSLGLSRRTIAGSVSRSRDTVSDVLTRAAKLGLEWPLPLEVTDDELQKILFPEKEKVKSMRTPDCEYIQKELSKPGVTLTLLWDEYCARCREAGEIPYQYSQYCKFYNKYAALSKATMHIKRKPGERMEVDWAGQTTSIRDNVTGNAIPAYIFVAVLPASQYAYVEAFVRRDLECWITANIHAFAYFGGVPRMVVPDNLKTGVDRTEWYTPVINRTYHEMAEHYGTAIVPARIRKPRDKPSVESTVGDISTWITAALRNQTYFSLPELNGDIAKKLADYNARPFQKRPGSRQSVFFEDEREFLLPLPIASYEIAVWKTATVGFNYHVDVDGWYYSVPYEYIKQCVDIRATSRVVEVFFNGTRVCSHVRKMTPHDRYQTVSEHMPPKHRKAGDWNGERFVSWAESMGANVAEVIRAVLAGCKVEQQGYRTCMGILRLNDKYGAERLEAACARALSYTPHPTYRNISAILKSGQDKAVPSIAVKKTSGSERHSFVRGAHYYGGDDHAE